MLSKSKKATLGGGCFWCLEAIFQRVKGVESVQSGYAGDSKTLANYQTVCSGKTKHAEVVQVQYNEDIIKFKDILTIFFGIHDPTTLNRQGNDAGPQYRSIIFYHDQTQQIEAQNYIKNLSEEKLLFFIKKFQSPIVTQVEQLIEFFPCETYHNNYYNDNPSQGYCRAVVDPKVKKFLSNYKEYLK